MQTKIVNIDTYRRAPKAHRSTMETVILNRNQMEEWTPPPFQRPLRINKKVQSVAEGLRAGHEIALEGIITLGKLPNSGLIYIVDGQHRIEGFKLSGVPEVIADIRLIHFDTIGEMAETFVKLNDHLVRMRPDDMLRGLESSNPVLQAIRRNAPFVGYDFIRRNTSTSPILSMSLVVRCWNGSNNEAPSLGAKSALIIVDNMTIDDANGLTTFLNAAMETWGRDQEYYRLWSSLNLTLTMWLWRKLVVEKPKGVKRYISLSPDQFKLCMMSQSASTSYLEWLTGRAMNDRDRSPAYARLKAIFTRRMTAEGKRIKFPFPTWASKAGGGRSFTL